MLTRVQLNLLGRRSYLTSVVALATSSQRDTISLENHDDAAEQQAYGSSDFDTNRKYLAFSWWLLNRGWVDVAARVERAVRTVFGSLSPRDLVSFDRFSQLTMEVRRLVEGATPEDRRSADWLSLLLPPRDQEADVIRQSGILEDNNSNLSSTSNSSSSSAALRRLLDETADLIESPSFSHVLTLLLDAGFSSLVDTKLATEAFDLPAPTPPAPSGGLFVAPNPHVEAKSTKVILLPKILSVLTRQAHVIGNGVPNEYLRDMESVRDLEAFAAVVYSSNWENEVREDGQGPQDADADAAGPNLMDSAIHVDPAVPQQQAQQQDSGLSGLESAWERALDKQAS